MRIVLLELSKYGFAFLIMVLHVRMNQGKELHMYYRMSLCSQYIFWGISYCILITVRILII